MLLYVWYFTLQFLRKLMCCFVLVSFCLYSLIFCFRYDVEPKLVNFMAPVDNCKLSDELRTELFSSIFGPSNLTSNVVMMWFCLGKSKNCLLNFKVLMPHMLKQVKVFSIHSVSWADVFIFIGSWSTFAIRIILYKMYSDGWLLTSVVLCLVRNLFDST